MKIKHMMQPLKIGPMTVPNRFVVPPMSNNFALPTGCLSQRSKAYYQERAKGGFGLITIEATVVDQTAKGGPRKSCLFDDSMIAPLAEVADACHKYGAKVSIQLQQAGPEGNAKAAGHPLKSASPIQAAAGKDVPVEMTTAQIYQLVEAYGDAALRAKEAGLDAVEVHCAHGYLVSSFLSPQTNKRLDEFGGSFENRMRLPRLILENIRKKTGSTLAVLCRINSSDEVTGGLTVQDSALIAAYLEDCGADALHISRSLHIHDEYMWAPTVIHGGFNAAHVETIRKAVSIPLIMVGRFNDAYMPELLVSQGLCDLVSFGRQSIADPHFPNKSAGGSSDEVVPCIACLQGCVCNMFQGKPITCLANPFVGFEEDLPLGKAEHKKKVLIAGGGIGGLYAAHVLAKRGHEVEVCEAGPVLGGQMRLAAFPPGKGDITNLMRSLITLCEKEGVTFRLGTEVTEDLIRGEAPDALVLATGARPLRPDIPGLAEAGAVDAVDVLDGKAVCGRNVLLVGGGMVGSETADFLAERGFQVTVVELRDQVAADVVSEHRLFLMKSFEENHVKTITGARVQEFVPGGVLFTDEEGNRKQLDGFDTVVLSLGAKAYNPLEEAAKGLVSETYVLGDAVKSRKALDATAEAREVAMKI